MYKTPANKKPPAKSSKPKTKTKNLSLTKRQLTALDNHKKKGTHTAKHMASMKRMMLAGATFTQAHKETMKSVGK